jgi:hypothetical protein
VNANHFIIAKIFEEEVNSPFKGKFEKHPAKTRSNQFGSVIFKFFATKKPSQKYHMQQKVFLKDMGLLII